MSHETLMWFHASWLGEFMRQSSWIFTAGLVIHFIGICLVVGAMLVVDLRLLGFARQMPIPAALDLLPVALVGFSLNAITGFAFFCFDPVLYWQNPAFKVKLVLLTLSGLNALAFTIWEHRRYQRGPDDLAPTVLTRMSAGLSLTLWLTIILFGRLIVAFQGSSSFFP